MGIFDQSLKLLLHEQPADFIGFALGQPVRVLRPLELPLPARGRELDGGYVVALPGQDTAVQIEFTRRHLSPMELALEVGEAQLRLFRREGLPVLPQLWDLYGDAAAPVVSTKELVLGALPGGEEGTRLRYQRVNLRALDFTDLLRSPLRALWPLVPLCRGGASESGVRQALQAIEARPDLSPTQRADHMAVLYFLAEAEDVPVLVLRNLIEDTQMKQSALYNRILAEGIEKGRIQGLEKGLEKGLERGLEKGLEKGELKATTSIILKVLTRRLRQVSPAVAERVRIETRPEVADLWCEDALRADDAEQAQRLHDRILNTPPPPL